MKPTVNNPRDLFFDQLNDIYSMEVQICRTMPRLVALCENESLRELLEIHAQQNVVQITEIVEIFQRHDRTQGDDRCMAITGLIEGGNAHLEAVEVPHTRDLMMIAHCLRIEYYEVAAYQITIRLAGRLGTKHETEILSELLEEERDMAHLLLKCEPELFNIANSKANA